MHVHDIKTICNLGTGTMGFGTALLFALNGYAVRMFGRSAASVERGFASIRGALDMYGRNGLVHEADIPAILAASRAAPRWRTPRVARILSSNPLRNSSTSSVKSGRALKI